MQYCTYLHETHLYLGARAVKSTTRWYGLVAAVLPSAYRVKFPSVSVTTGPRTARWSSFFPAVVC